MINNTNTLIMLHNIHKLQFFVFYFCRLLQGVETRTAAKDVMLGLPRVPTCCLSLLRLLVHTGTRAIAPPQGDRSTPLDCTTNLACTPCRRIHHVQMHCTAHLVTVNITFLVIVYNIFQMPYVTPLPGFSLLLFTCDLSVIDAIMCPTFFYDTIPANVCS
jgi:hypothetical protein